MIIVGGTSSDQAGLLPVRTDESLAQVSGTVQRITGDPGRRSSASGRHEPGRPATARATAYLASASEMYLADLIVAETVYRAAHVGEMISRRAGPHPTRPAPGSQAATGW